LSSVSRPTYLQPGQARDDVQQVTLNPSIEQYELRDNGTGLFGRGEQVVSLKRGWTLDKIREALETAYKKGNVEVTEVSSESYDITFVNELADLPVNPITAEVPGGVTPVEVTEVAKGRPDGEVVLTAANLGDARTTTECIKKAPGEGQYSDASCATFVNPGKGEFEVTLKEAVKVSDALPSGLHALAIEGTVDETLGALGAQAPPLACSLGSLTCTFSGKLPAEFEGFEGYPKFVSPYEVIRVLVAVNLTGAGSPGLNVATVTGGGAPSVTARQPITVSATPPPFGVNSYELRPEAQGGGLDTQAGSHPFQLTTTFGMNETFEAKPLGLAKDAHFKLPPGLIGNPTAVPQCTLAQFLTGISKAAGSACTAQTVVGVARSTYNLFSRGHRPVLETRPLYNLEPSVGEPARFGYILHEIPILLTTAVRTGGDYGVTVSSTNITQEVEFLSSEVTFWGVPGNEAHNNARGFGCLELAQHAARGEEFQESHGRTCQPLQSSPSPLLSLPTACTGSPLETSVEVDSWQAPQNLLSFPNTEPMATMDGCNRLPFEPEVKVTPDGQAASTPTGVNVDVHVNQDSILNPEGLAEAAVKDITVALPEGVAVNPAGGDGLQACSEGLVGYLPGQSTPPEELHFTATPKLPEPMEPGVNFCPSASKVGSVTIHSPLLPPAQPLKGFVYLATQNENPFGSLVALYIVAEDPISGTLVKLPGETRLAPSGQIVGIFKNNPQLAFEDAELHFFGGERAPLSSPAHCGAYTTNASFTPWSGNEPVNATSTFDITSGPHGAPCPGSSLPFSPSLTGGTTNINAGAFSPLTTTIGREDGQQDMQSVTLHMPPGLSGLLSGVKLCPEAQANEGTCGPESQIGETTVSAGVGNDPVSVKGGRVYITEKYAGAPFGLSIVNPVKAGPFDLERDTSNPSQNPPCDCVVVRAKIEVDPHTADLTITTDQSGPHAIPHLIDGIPVQIKKVNVLVNRPNFTFNPTNCSPLTITGAIVSDEGASSPVSMPFQSTNCATLKFAPKFSVSTSGKTSKANGASLTAKLSYPTAPFGSQAEIARVKVDLPKQLPSRLTTLQKACTNAQFVLNPAGCPAASKIGFAKVTTPLLPVPLSGPAIFVSHGGEAFPSLTMVLQGYGVTIDLVGSTFISKAGITSTTFKTVPDTPFNTFELTLPEGKFSALAANGNLCKSKLAMPTAFVAQNGLEIHQSTKVSVTGCPKAKKSKKKAKHHGGSKGNKQGKR
jgi:hypothetical protein